MRKQKQEKMIQVFVLCPNDMEKPNVDAWTKIGNNYYIVK